MLKMLGQFSIREARRHNAELPSKRGFKRARVVCCRCHEKKIKCDLPPSDGDQTGHCSNCCDAGVPCELRKSKRGHKHKRLVDPLSIDLLEGSLYIDDRAHPPPSPPLSGQPAEGSINAPPSIPDENAIVPYTVSIGPVQNPSLPDPQSSYLGDSGYMQIFSCESGGDTTLSKTSINDMQPIDDIPPVLQETHLEVYFEFATTWCPILDYETYESTPQFKNSLLLKHALALCSNRIRPALVEHAASADHYQRVKELFYNNHEPNPLVRMIALMLLYWYSADGPNTVSIDNTWWWTGVVIRLAQQMRLYRQSPVPHALCQGDTPSLRRRIWWTLVTRERISSISQGRPCVIDIQDCNIPMPTKDDFPNPNDIRTSIFLAWLELCDIVGRIGQQIRRDTSFSVVSFAGELVSWVQSLPPTLHPAINKERTMNLHPDVHGLHLTYLSTITLMHLNKTSQPLPQASTAAVVAASCTSRIFYDYLLRGSLRFLAGQAGWYITTAILPLVHARRVEGLRQAADRDIKILRAAIKEMARLWPSARTFEKSTDKLLNINPADTVEANRQLAGISSPLNDNSLEAEVGIDWRAYFPYISPATSPLIEILLSNSPTMPVPETEFTFDFSGPLNDFLIDPDTFNMDFLPL